MKKFLSVLVLAMLCTGVTAFAQTTTYAVNSSSINNLLQILSSSNAFTLASSPSTAAPTYKPVILATTKTVEDLMYAVRGEMTANAKYLKFADAADAEGYHGVAGVFRAISDAELKHSQDEFAIAQRLNPDVVLPVTLNPYTVGTTRENLQAAIDGETEEYTSMYVNFRATANTENQLDARGIFTLAKLAEQVHAGIYADLLANLDNFDSAKYGVIYRCPTCGNIMLGDPKLIACPKCADGGGGFIQYTITN